MSILEVVGQTLNSRLDGEQQFRKRYERAQEELSKVLQRFKSLQTFHERFQATIKAMREAIEEAASRMAREVPRHEFRHRSAELSAFAQRYDTFDAEFEGLEETAAAFTSRVPYIRGIAAHYANKPDLAVRYLTKVVESAQPEAGEPEVAWRRRCANAHYYLGLTDANFGDYTAAIERFEAAYGLDSQKKDLLTRVVTAEAYGMGDHFDTATDLLRKVIEQVDSMEAGSRRLESVYQRLRSRSLLVAANIALWQRGAAAAAEAESALRRVRKVDPAYYFATATLAQLRVGVGDAREAKELFAEAHQWIERLGDLLIVGEARSRMLLLMVAAMCCKHGLDDHSRADDLLDRAAGARGALPRLGEKTCTIFSPLSKRNEDREAILAHIERVREGQLLVMPSWEILGGQSTIAVA